MLCGMQTWNDESGISWSLRLTFVEVHYSEKSKLDVRVMFWLETDENSQETLCQRERKHGLGGHHTTILE